MTPSERKVEPEELEQRALTLRTVGWLLLIFDVAIIAVFIFVGLRSGSLLWLYWLVIQGIVGLGLVAAGRYQESVASERTGEAAAPKVQAEDKGERAA